MNFDPVVAVARENFVLPEGGEGAVVLGAVEGLEVDPDKLSKGFDGEVGEVLDLHLGAAGLELPYSDPVRQVVAELVRGAHREEGRRARVQLIVVKLQSAHYTLSASGRRNANDDTHT